MAQVFIFAALLLASASVASAQTGTMRLDLATCQTFSQGASGHSERCVGPKIADGMYQLIIHDREARIDIEIARPGHARGRDVLRLSNHLGKGQRFLAQQEAIWHLKDEDTGLIALNFSVEPQPYEQFIPLMLIIRFDGEAKDCVIATIGEGSRRTLESVISDFETRPCRPGF